jgi:hypothetical protein
MSHRIPQKANETKARVAERDRLLRKICDLGGIASSPMSDQVSDLELGFLHRVIAWEEGPFTTHREWLRRRGQSFPAITEIPPERLSRVLWQLIEALASARVFLMHTDHLSDSSLYVKLTTEVLDGNAPDFARCEDDAYHRDFADPSAGHDQEWLTFYADEHEREEWRSILPETLLPPRQRPAHDRDRLLPTPR